MSTCTAPRVFCRILLSNIDSNPAVWRYDMYTYPAPNMYMNKFKLRSIYFKNNTYPSYRHSLSATVVRRSPWVHSCF